MYAAITGGEVHGSVDLRHEGACFGLLSTRTDIGRLGGNATTQMVTGEGDHGESRRRLDTVFDHYDELRR